MEEEPKVENNVIQEQKEITPKVPKIALIIGIVLVVLIVVGGAGSFMLGRGLLSGSGLRIVSLDQKNETATFNTGTGTITAGENVKLPANFPKEVPVYPGGTTKLASVDESGILAGFETTDKFADAVTKYRNALIKNGWQVTGGENPATNEYKIEMMSIRNNQYAGTAQIVGKDDEKARMVNITVSKQELKSLQEMEQYNPEDWE